MSDATASAVTRTTYGVVRIGEVRIALPVGALREVVPLPDALEPLPAAAPGLLGAVRVRRAVVPVVDLRQWFGAPDATSDRPAAVALVAHGGQLLGLAVAGIATVVEVETAARQPVTAEDAELLLTHTFQVGGSGDVVHVLDVDRVLRLPGVPRVGEVLDATTGGRRGDTVQLTLLRVGAHVVALDVDRVHTTLAPAPVLPSVLAGGDCLGATAHDGELLPVLDPVSLLGLGPPDPARRGPRAVLSLPAGKVVLLLDAVLRIIEAPADAIRTVPQHALRRPGLFRGLLDVPGVGHVLVVDGAALHDDEQVTTLSRMVTREQGDTASDQHERADQQRDGVTLDRPAYVLYRAGDDLATRLEQVAEIIPLPRELVDTSVGDDLVGLVLHRERSVPVHCLASLLGRRPAPRTATACVLLVAVAGVTTGFLVDELDRIDRRSWVEAEADAAAKGRAGSPLLTIGDDTTLLSELDLHALARRVHGAVPA